jgi:hypothetical protein
VSAKGLGNPSRLAGAAVNRERIAWERVKAGSQCQLRACTYDAISLVEGWDGRLGFACAIHADQAESLGYAVLRDPSERIFGGAV